jgi:TIR domain
MSLGASKKGDSMITQTAEIDEATRPSRLDMALESSTSFPGQQPSPPLRVFISYKEKDRAATLDIKRVLLKIGGGNIRVFVSGDEPAGIQWREGVLNELRNAHILIFLYTDPEARWDWCLYETGYFDAKQNPTELDRRLYVLHGREVPPSGPFLGLNTVPIDTSAKPDDTRLKHFLGILFERSTNPAVNPYWDEGGCADLVTALAAPFRGRKALAPPEEYVRRLTFRLTKEAATEAALNEGRIPADAMVSGNKKSFELFGLRAAKTWQDLEKSWQKKLPPGDGSTSPDPVALWVESVAQKMLAAINEEDFDDGLPLFFNQFAETRAQALFRPSLARLVLYADAYEFDVVFVDVPPELAAMSEGPLTTVGGLLRLAHMFRFGWIETTAKEVVNRPLAELAEVARNMGRRLSSITAESFNQGIRTEQAVLLAFEEGSALQTEIKQAIKEWQETVYPEIDKSFKDKDTRRILAALKKASAVNWQFHRACAKRYWDIVEKHCAAASGPLDPV